MSSISATLTVRTAGTGLPPPPPTTPPPTTTPPPAPTPSPTPAPTTVTTPFASTLATQTVTTYPGMATLLLDTARWDLVTDAAGNLAVASPPYAIAQDAASTIRLFQGELWYDTSRGVPYFQQILGKQPPLAVLKNAVTAAAISVPSVQSAQTYLSAINDRGVIGQVHLTTTAGTTIVVTGKLQANQTTTSLKDSAGNPMSDSAGNLMFTVM